MLWFYIRNIIFMNIFKIFFTLQIFFTVGGIETPLLYYPTKHPLTNFASFEMQFCQGNLFPAQESNSRLQFPAIWGLCFSPCSENFLIGNRKINIALKKWNFLCSEELFYQLAATLEVLILTWISIIVNVHQVLKFN